MIESKVEMYDQEASLEYPYLAKSDATGAIVLFEAPRMGCIVCKGGCAYPVGYYTTSWSEDAFTPLPKGSKVILEQS